MFGGCYCNRNSLGLDYWGGVSMKVRMFCRHDYANMMHGVVKALKLARVDCEGFVHHLHRFGYGEQCPYADYNQMREYAAEADVIHIFHSDNEILKFIGGDWSGKKLFVWHTGTPYRQNKRFHDTYWKGYQVFTDQAEFITGGLKAQYIAAGVDFDGLRNVIEPITSRFGHFPSDPYVKGTKEIENVFRGSKIPINVDIGSVSHEQNIKRIASCEVYVELYAPTQNGKPYGQWGVTAMEAAAMRRIVITNEHSDVYKRFYGDSFVYNATNKFHLAAMISQFNKMGSKELSDRQYESWFIANKNHNYQAVAERVMNEL